jgi:2',3'-cyclic-nucleotide 2'-phosphodiesterase (5'-nucleotidase family)
MKLLSYLSLPVTCLLLGTCLLSLLTGHAVAAERQARLIFTAELPRILETEQGDYAELASIVKTQRKQPIPTFFLFGGDSLGPSTLASFDRGSHIIDILNLLEPDAMGVAKREFSFFEDELSLRSYEASFPVVASNLFDPITGGNLDGLESSVIVQQGDVRLGVIAVFSPAAAEQYPLNRVMITSPEEAVREQSVLLRQAGAELIVLLYSANFDFVDGLIQQRVVDVALRKNELFRLTKTELPKTLPANINLSAPGEVAVVDLHWTAGAPETLQLKPTFQQLKAQQADPAVLKVVKSHSARLEQLLGETIGTTTVELDTNRRLVRSQENALANLVVDAMVWHTGADIALVNAGNIRGEKHYPAGTTLTRRDIAMELPYRNQVVLVQVTGKQLLAALENSLSEFELLRGRFAHLSGMQMQFDPSQPVGKRVISVLINGQPLVPKQQYKLATFDYLAEGGDGYKALVELPQLNYSNQMNKLIAEVVVDYIKMQKNIAPVLQQRLVNTARSQP